MTSKAAWVPALIFLSLLFIYFFLRRLKLTDLLKMVSKLLVSLLPFEGLERDGGVPLI